jgi:hypothetical protein
MTRRIDTSDLEMRRRRGESVGGKGNGLRWRVQELLLLALLERILSKGDRGISLELVSCQGHIWKKAGALK